MTTQSSHRKRNVTAEAPTYSDKRRCFGDDPAVYERDEEFDKCFAEE